MPEEKVVAVRHWNPSSHLDHSSADCEWSLSRRQVDCFFKTQTVVSTQTEAIASETSSSEPKKSQPPRGTTSLVRSVEIRSDVSSKFAEYAIPHLVEASEMQRAVGRDLTVGFDAVSAEHIALYTRPPNPALTDEFIQCLHLDSAVSHESAAETSERRPAVATETMSDASICQSLAVATGDEGIDATEAMRPMDDVSIADAASVGQSDVVWITFRNNLNKLCASLFAHKQRDYDSWRIQVCAQFVDASNQWRIRLEISDTIEQQKSTEEYTKWMHFGRELETVLTKEKVSKAKETEALQRVDFNVVMECTLSSQTAESVATTKHTLFVGAEVDCVDEKSGHFVEVKSTKFLGGSRRAPRRAPCSRPYDKFRDSQSRTQHYEPYSVANGRWHPRAHPTAECSAAISGEPLPFIAWYKAWKWWIQSVFVSENERFAVGFRTADGVLVEVHNCDMDAVLRDYARLAPARVRRMKQTTFAHLSWILNQIFAFVKQRAKDCKQKTVAFHASYQWPFESVVFTP